MEEKKERPVLNEPTQDVSISLGDSKDTKFISQKRKVLKAFSEYPKTMLMVSIETNVLRANICRFIAQWEKTNLIQLIEKKDCKISKHKAGYYTTGKDTIWK